MSPVKCVHKAVRNSTVNVAANYSCRLKLPKKTENTFKMGHDPELGTSPELEPDTVSYYLTFISILRWMIELQRINMITNMSLLSFYVALPRERHLDAAVHFVVHVGQRYNSRLVYDILYQGIDHSIFKKFDWSEFYGMPRRL